MSGPYSDYGTDALIAELRRQHDDYQPADWAIVWEVIGRLLAEREIVARRVLDLENVIAEIWIAVIPPPDEVHVLTVTPERPTIDEPAGVVAYVREMVAERDRLREGEP
jgi:hypothetical protein